MWGNGDGNAAAPLFYRYGAEVTSIEQASETLEPLVGSLKEVDEVIEHRLVVPAH